MNERLIYEWIMHEWMKNKLINDWTTNERINEWVVNGLPLFIWIIRG